MTQEQKLEIVYKKLFNQRAFTKEGTQFFEEPFSAFSQVPLSYVYVNSDYIPNTAPYTTISVAGIETLTYIEKERSIPVDSSGLRFKAKNQRIIPTSYGIGYGLEMRTQSGSIIDTSDFPCLIDWESGEVKFDSVPFDVDLVSPPLFSYHFYSGKTLETVQSFTTQGPRGNIGDTGPTGPIDDSTLIYRGKTDFTVVPAVQYNTNDVVTFTTDGNSYICLSQTTSSPISSPGSWENISPSGMSQDMPTNVLYVNHPNAIATSNLSRGSQTYYTSLQDAIDNSPDGVSTTIIVNQLNNQYPIADENVRIHNKILSIIFRKWANLSSPDIQISGFNIDIIDSDVTIHNATIGGGLVFSSYEGQNSISLGSIQGESILKLVECKINSKIIHATRTADNNSTLIFERCSINTERIVTNGDLIMNGSTFSGSITGDYTSSDVQGKKHIFNIINSFGFQRTTRGSLRNLQAYDIVILANRDDLKNVSVKLENAVLPLFGVVLKPDAFIYSPDVFVIDANNSTFYGIGIDERSSFQGGTLNIVGSNNIYAIIFNNFESSYFTLHDLNSSIQEVFYYAVDQQGTQVPVVTWDQGSIQTIGYDAYKSLVIQEIERLMLSI